LLVEIRWHSRGGQGGWTASNLAALAASYEGKYVQSFPAFGPERSGAPIMAFTRISDEPVEIHSMVYSPDIVVVLDYTLLSPSILSGLKQGGFIITNYTGSEEQVFSSLGIKKGDYRVVLIPASKLALEVLKSKITNTAMLAGIVKIGAERALLTTAKTIGSLRPLAIYKISTINAKPCEEVAVNALAPAAAAPTHALIAECSDSTGTNSVCTSPLATNSEYFSTIIVCGVMGYAATTST